MNTLFTVIFESGESFSGGDLDNTKWLDIPEKKIRSLFYRLPTGDYLCLASYDKYCQYLEACVDLSGVEKGKTRIEFIYLLGRIDNLVRVYKIDLKKQIVSITNTNMEDNFVKKINSIGWK